MLATAVLAGLGLPPAPAAGDEKRLDTVWAFTVLDYAAVGSNRRPVERLWYPTREACEAARQAVVEIGEEERPVPVVGHCLSADPPGTRPSG